MIASCENRTVVNGRNTPESSAYAERRELFLSYLEKEARGRRVITIQGPRTFLWPKPDKGDEHCQHWGYKPLAAGWRLTNDIAERIQKGAPGIPITHYGVIADKRQRIRDYEGVEPKVQMELLRESSAEVSASPLFMNGHGNHPPVNIFLEGDIKKTTKAKQGTECMGAVQLRKLADHVAEFGNAGGVPLKDADKILNLIVVPWGFGVQQSMVMEAFLGEMRKNEVTKRLPRVARRELIERTVRHVWIGASGLVFGVSRPMWAGSNFTFVPELV